MFPECSPFYIERFYKFYRTLFRKCLYPQLLNSSIDFTKLFFSVLSKSESVKFLLIESVICLFTDSPVKKYISLLNQLIITN